MIQKYCKHCHTCGAHLKNVLDGEEWCSLCQEYRRYVSHGWSAGRAIETSPCPEVPALPHIENVVSKGLCPICGETDRPLVSVPMLYVANAERADGIVEGDSYRFAAGAKQWWTNYYQVVYVLGADLVLYGVDAEAYKAQKICFNCFDGHLTPTERAICINIPSQMEFDPEYPWANARWVENAKYQEEEK